MTPRIDHRFSRWRRHPRRTARHTVVRLVRCEDAREAISARFDNERVTVLPIALDRHLASCKECHQFERDIVRLAHLARRAGAGPSTRLVPPDLHAALTSLLSDPALTNVGRAAPRGARLLLASRRAGRRWARWSAALVPAVLLLIAWPLSPASSSSHLTTAHRPPMCSPKLLEW